MLIVIVLILFWYKQTIPSMANILGGLDCPVLL